MVLLIRSVVRSPCHLLPKYTLKEIQTVVFECVLQWISFHGSYVHHQVDHQVAAYTLTLLYTIVLGNKL